MAKAKYNYDDEGFYKAISIAAANGMCDAEIADTLELDPETFSRMKNGTYIGWSKEENERRSARVLQCLERARRKVNALVRGRFLKAALGGIKIKSTQSRAISQRCSVCGGTDPQCPECGGTGTEFVTDKKVVMLNEQETPPNINALATWLFQHDKEWRKIQMSKGDESEEVPKDIDHGIDIDKWIESELGK